MPHAMPKETPPTQPFSRKAAIVGVGYTEFSRHSGKSVLELATTAVNNALKDAGLDASSVDSILTYHLNDSVPATTMAKGLGIKTLNWHNDIYGGGTQSASILGDAAMLIDQGQADTIIIYRALNGRSGKRMGQVSIGAGDESEQQFLSPYGLLGPVHLFALTCQRYLHDRGYSTEALTDVVLAQKKYAAINPKAISQKKLTRDEYFSSPTIASPLHRYDCCLETDGACAIVVTGIDKANTLKKPPIVIEGAVRGGFTTNATPEESSNIGAIFSSYIAPRLYEQTGLSPADIDIAYLYDAYSFLVLQQLEDFGFCDKGRAPQFIQDGNTGLKGLLPTNTNGGLLSEGYVHGLNNIVEAVQQLRGECGERQTTNPQRALCTGFGGSYGSAAVLSTNQSRY